MGNENITIEQTGGVTPNMDTPVGNPTTVTEPTATEPVSNIPEINEYLKAQEEPATEPTKIKVGEQEYTQEELAELVTKAQTPQEKPKEEPQIREISLIDTDIKTLEGKAGSDLGSMYQRFMSRVPDSDKVQAYDDLIKSVETNNYTDFIKHLSPVEVQEFLNEKTRIENTYNGAFDSLYKEKETTQTQALQKENLGKWDGFIQENLKENPAAQHFFNFGKSNAYFDEGHAKAALQAFNESLAIALNGKEMKTQTDQIKTAMMDGTPAAPTATIGKIFTREDVKTMSSAQFAKNEKAIFEQIKKGLLK